MGIAYNSRVIVEGLIECFEPNLADGSSPQVIGSKTSSSTFTSNNFSTSTTTSGIKVLNSNVLSDGSGTSHLVLSRNTSLETGSITFIIWLNLNNIPIDVGANNNWRGLLCTANSGTAGSPLTMVLEQGRVINFSTTHTDLYRRNLNNNFNPISVDATGWQMVSYTYNSTTGTAACYKNQNLILSGPMTVDASNGSPTGAGTQLSYTNYQSGGFRIYGGTNTVANPNGNGVCPGFLGNIYVYNRALTSQEIQQNYTALKGRFGLT
jgi:hypothetical protein